jgi:hypothetical protein
MKLLGNYGNSIYMWTWSLIPMINSRDCPSNGSWTASNEVNNFPIIWLLTPNTKTRLDQILYSRNGIGRIGFVKA